MKATIYFIYASEPACSRECENNAKDIESSIRYWLGKSPGVHEIDKIFVVPEGQGMDWTPLLRIIHNEETANEERRQEEDDRELFERLKARFEK